ncbi:protein SODIUM POTASSIUM ROOT DEFECTIVE 3-like [Arachis duranensis]|uniref:Protein SODIUM POTASSIUM ROOT DEFECTIVE 3-like n=1 Tax=Arachis duranensis TaxID=130453 RepID=A0A6P4CKY3_ARADU|nr:protein SODIUM POTASSIUM ROOT DEFECTIVE 3-like [Arachis duranensis]
MKLMDLFCSSNSSTATSSMHQHHHGSMVPKRSKKTQLPNIVLPCSSSSSQLIPLNPKPRKSTSRCSSSSNMGEVVMRRHNSVELRDLYTTSGSSRRYLLATDTIQRVSDSANNSLVLSHDNYKPHQRDHHLLRSSSVRSTNQVVVLRVSLHCKACEGKLRKHISRMEGVRSFSIDMETKKVTIIGDVTPLGVLASVSKVKNAHLWPYPSTTSSSS